MTPIFGFLRDAPPRLVGSLKQRYADPRRGYHTWQHIGEVLAQLSSAHQVEPFESPEEIVYAALFHDAVLEPLAKDNEEESARLAEAVLPVERPLVKVAAVARLVRLTAAHGTLSPADVSADEARFLDADLAIIAAPPERFASYERGVAKEYAALPEEVYRAGRKAFLRGLLEKPVLFLSPYFRERLEGAARANLARAVAEIES